MTLTELKRAARAKGSHFFDAGAMRFFGSKVYGDTVIESRFGVVFVTSEAQPADAYFGIPQGRRCWTVRCLNLNNGDVKTVGSFQQWGSKVAAVRAAKHYALNGTEIGGES